MSDEPFQDGSVTLSFLASAAPDRATLLVPTWLPVAAVHGTGSVLLGPHRDGAQAIIPPAVLARTPRHSENEYDEHGWRLAVWDAVGGGRIDASRPRHLRTMLLDEVVYTVAAEAPQHMPWVKGEVVQRIQCLTVLLRHSSMTGSRLHGMRLELNDLLLDASRHFGEAWLQEELRLFS